MAKHSVRGKDVIKVAKELATPRRGGKEDFTHNQKDPCPRYRTVQHPITDHQICRLASPKGVITEVCRLPLSTRPGLCGSGGMKGGGGGRAAAAINA